MNEPMITLKSAEGEGPVRRFVLAHSETGPVAPLERRRRAPVWALLLGVRTT